MHRLQVQHPLVNPDSVTPTARAALHTIRLADSGARDPPVGHLRERELALRQYAVTKEESLIGYEASNHYYYTPLDLLLEKALNCEQVMARLRG